MKMSKQSSVEQIFSHIKASRNDIQYWNDSMLVDWLLEQEDRLKAMHKEEMIDAISVGGCFRVAGGVRRIPAGRGCHRRNRSFRWVGRSSRRPGRSVRF